MSVTIRVAGEMDTDGIAAVQVASWRAAYAGIVPQSHLDAMTVEERADRWRVWVGDSRVLVAEDAGRVIGFQAYGPAREPNFGFHGELYAAYFLPEAMGKGLGSRMIADVADGLKALGFDDMIVWVMEANTRGIRFYRDLLKGTSVPSSRRSFEIEGTALWEIAYGFRPLSQLALRR